MQNQKKRYQSRYIVLITLIMGALLLTYRLAAEPFFAYFYLSETQRAYETIRELEWEEYGPDEETLEELDEIDRRIPVVIADDTFTLLYGQNPVGENADFSAVIRERKEEFTEDARAVISRRERSKLPASVSLYGRISIGGRLCYVYLHRNISGLARRIRFTGLALTVMAVIFLLVCIILFLVLSERFCRPYVKMSEDLRKVLDGEHIPDQVSAADAGQSETYELINRLREKLLAYDAQVQNYAYMAEHEMGAAQREQGTQKQLVSHITHQLKTPLAIISSQVELAQGEENPEKRDYYYTSVMEEIDKMSLLISNILRDYKQEKNYVSTRLRRVNISDLMTDLIPKYEGWLMRNRIRFSADVQEGIFVMADPDQLEQAVHNYMMNAVSHTRPDRKITLTLTSDGGFARIAVYNEGNGIPPADLEKIWKSHYQTAGTRGPSETGLGLYIVKLIVSRHAGRCGAGNADNGVTFWIELPVLDGTETEVITHGRAGGEW